LFLRAVGGSARANSSAFGDDSLRPPPSLEAMEQTMPGMEQGARAAMPQLDAVLAEPSVSAGHALEFRNAASQVRLEPLFPGGAHTVVVLPRNHRLKSAHAEGIHFYGIPTIRPEQMGI
jgi:hypothetical protein